MNWSHSPFPFPEVFVTTLLYLSMVGSFFAMIVFAALLVQSVRNGLDLRKVWASVGRLTLFLFLLLGYGAGAQVVWSSAVWGRLYYSADYVFGYLPFLPITRSEINFQFGGKTGALNDISLAELNLIWLGITGVVWYLTIWSYKKLRLPLRLSFPTSSAIA